MSKSEEQEIQNSMLLWAIKLSKIISQLNSKDLITPQMIVIADKIKVAKNRLEESQQDTK